MHSHQILRNLENHLGTFYQKTGLKLDEWIQVGVKKQGRGTWNDFNLKDVTSFHPIKFTLARQATNAIRGAKIND